MVKLYFIKTGLLPSSGALYVNALGICVVCSSSAAHNLLLHSCDEKMMYKVCVYKCHWLMNLVLFLSDQIDENLKLTLQEDLTSMAPGIIIQVLFFLMPQEQNSCK